MMCRRLRSFIEFGVVMVVVSSGRSKNRARALRRYLSGGKLSELTDAELGALGERLAAVDAGAPADETEAIH
jgi:hypothetical protein